MFIRNPISGNERDVAFTMPRALADARLSSVRMLLQVHDELVFEAKEADVEKALKTVARVMEKAAEPAVRLKVPVHVDAKAADNWEAAH